VSPCQFVWDGQECTPEDAKDGVILTLTFEVSDGIADGTELGIRATIPNGDAIDNDLKKVDVETNNGAVTVADYVPGDVNKDGTVSSTDIVMLRRYIAGGYNLDINVHACNVNRDSTVTTADVILIRRYLAGGYGVNLYSCDCTTAQHTHNFTVVEYQAPSCTEDGNIAYWYCDSC
jgi:hypothetical protein